MKSTLSFQFLFLLALASMLVISVVMVFVSPKSSFAQTIGAGSIGPDTTVDPGSSSSSGSGGSGTATYPPCSSLQPGVMIPCSDSGTDTQNPGALWKFDEGSGGTTIDSVGGATGTLVNFPTWVLGKSGSALNFNGTNTYVHANAPLISNLNSVTVSAWIYARSDGNNAIGVRRIVSKSTFNDTTGAQVRFALQLGANGTLQFNTGYISRNGIWGTQANAVSLNQWHQVAATYTFGNANTLPALYVDGVPQQVSVVTAPVSNTPTSDDQTLYIGDRGDNTRVWDGLIDQLRIYSRALSAFEITKLYALENVQTNSAGSSTAPPVAPSPSTQPGTSAQPNIVVIMTDDQDDTGSLDFMPQVQQLLLNQGTRFTNSFVDFSLCCPSRASFLTGESAHNHGIVDIVPPGGGYGLFIPQEGNTLPVWLQNAGYDTAVIGKYLNGYGTLSSETHTPVGWNTYAIFEQNPGLRYFGYRMNENGVIKTYGSSDAEYQTDVLTQKASDYIDSRQSSSKPFFLWLTPHAPHNDGGQSDTGPIMPDSPQPAPKYRGLFANQPLPTLPNFNEADVSDKPGHIAMRPLLNASAIARTTANYRGRLVSDLSVDDMVAKVVSELQKTGKLDNTIIIYTSDNGWANGQHRYLYGKEEVYDEIIRVPLIIRGPGIPKSQVRTPLVNNLDVVATIEDLTHITPGKARDGSSLLPLLNNSNIPWRTALYVQGTDVPTGTDAGTGGNFTAVRTNNYLYAEHISPVFGTEKEFYDLTKDPFELVSRPNDPAYANVVNALSATLSKLKTCVGKDCWITTPDVSPPLVAGAITSTQQTRNLPAVTDALPVTDPEEASNTGGWGTTPSLSMSSNSGSSSDFNPNPSQTSSSTAQPYTPFAPRQMPDGTWAQPTGAPATGTGSPFTSQLRVGMTNKDVTRLQTFLAQDPSLYPTGLVTGYFGPLTKQAVVRFQEKYASEILKPLGLSSGTGNVGSATLKKLNELMQ